MPALIVCRACGSSPEGYSTQDAEAGVTPDEACGCGEFAWTVWDVDASELDGHDDDGELMNCPECGSELTYSETDEGACWDCGGSLA